MDFKQIQELIKMVNKSNLSEVTIEEKVIVGAEQNVSSDATNNANQTVISGQDLDASRDRQRLRCSHHAAASIDGGAP